MVVSEGARQDYTASVRYLTCSITYIHSRLYTLTTTIYFFARYTCYEDFTTQEWKHGTRQSVVGRDADKLWTSIKEAGISSPPSPRK